MTSPTSGRPHCVAVIGGAVAGAQITGHLSEKGVSVVVFEQNPRPFGKIEDGLPRWHHKLREKEYRAIGDKLSHPNVHYVPNTEIGADIGFAALCNDWGFSAVVLANGAWRDRPLAIPGADHYVGRGLIYQNPFVTWWNHLEESSYKGPTFEVHDNTIVLGGGLASIDVAKILMLETTRAKLLLRGIDIDVVTLEVKGIPKILEGHGLVFEDLGLEGCTIFYRRRIEDMPVVSIPDNASEERTAKARKSRATLLEKAMKKYCFKIQELAVADSLITEDDTEPEQQGDRLVGLVFRRTAIEDGRVVATDKTFERRSSQIISSIGSIPQAISGIPMAGEFFNFADADTGRLSDFPSVFSVGNVVTGKGNIVASRKHADHVAIDALEGFLGVSDNPELSRENEESLTTTDAQQAADAVAKHLVSAPLPTSTAYAATLARVAKRQQAVKYPGNFESWLKQAAPVPR